MYLNPCHYDEISMQQVTHEQTNEAQNNITGQNLDLEVNMSLM